MVHPQPVSRFLIFSFLVVGLGSGVSMAQGTRDRIPNSTQPSFEKDILPIFQTKCLRCHGTETHKGDLDLRAISGLIKGGESGQVIVPGNLEKSLLFAKVKNGEMPPGKKDPLSDAQLQTIQRWILLAADGQMNPKGPTESKNLTQGDQSPPGQHEIIPIFLRHCTVCHGLHRQEAGLDLRTRAAILKGGKSGPALVPGKPEESRIYQKIHSGQMPPNDRLVEVSVKPTDSQELEILKRWIALGAPDFSIEPDIATMNPDPLVSDKDREFWAFRPPQQLKVPKIIMGHGNPNPIDEFILQKQMEKGLRPGPEADRATLIRRAYFDLTGLPPEPGELQSFLTSTDPDAFEKMIDRLLASPRYGERWGRYWLDLVGYADSEGKREQDLPRPYAWRYRDYVIRSFNADKPFNRFLMEQIAGDELADYEKAPEITQEIYDNLVATGFLRMAPDATWANITGYVPDRLEVIADEMDVLGSAVMGLTMKCARCHTHKFDPIPHRDYYRLVAIFKGALDEYDWLKPEVKPGIGPVSQDFLKGRHLPFVATKERKAWEENETRISEQIGQLRVNMENKTREWEAKHRNSQLAKMEPSLQKEIQILLTSDPAQRDPKQIKLAQTHEKLLRPDRELLKTNYPELKAAVSATESQIRLLESQRQPEPRIQALWDRGEPSPTYIYRRGDPLTPTRLVGPGVPSMLTDGKTPFVVTPPWPGARQTGRRLAFAKWLTQPDHPLTARVAVNRLWKHHFGNGIVKSLGNFGKTGTPPTHPELLDWLAVEFQRNGWSVKAMHRLLMTSKTYKQSSLVNSENEKWDPDNRWLSRMPMFRLDAEALYDSLLLVAGRLDEKRFGPGDPVASRADGLVMPGKTGKGWRRLIYLRQARKEVATHLENFDFPQMNPNCIERRDSIVAPQALHLMNNAMVFELAESFASRVTSEAGPELSRQIELVYQVSMSRSPSREELTLGLESLSHLIEKWTRQPGNEPNRMADAARKKALTAYCHAILNSAGFLYVD